MTPFDYPRLTLAAKELREDAACAADCDHPYKHLDEAADGIDALIKENKELTALIGPHDWVAEDLIKDLVDNAQSFQEISCVPGDDPMAILLLAAAARIRRQEAKISATGGSPMTQAHRIVAAITGVDPERDQLKAEVEALRKDAERYRWLRHVARMDGIENDMEEIGALGSIFVCVRPGEAHSAFGESLDDAVDAAMGKEAGHG